MIYAEARIKVSRHQTIMMAEWEIEGGDDPFAIIDTTRDLEMVREEMECELKQVGLSQWSQGPSMKSMFDIQDRRIQELATKLLAIPGVEADTEQSKAAFVIQCNRVHLGVAPDADLDLVERELVAALVEFFSTVEPPEVVARIYRFSVQDTRPLD